MRVTIAVIALLFPFAAANAAVGDKFNCDVKDAQNIGVDDKGPWSAKMRVGRHQIVIQRDSVLVIPPMIAGKIDSREFKIIAGTNEETIGIRVMKDLSKISTIIIDNVPGYNNKYSISLSDQTAAYAGVVFFWCDKTF
jgi:hypothetical protein